MPAQHKKALTVALQEGFLILSQNKALVFQYLNFREDALASWREAATLADNLGEPNLAAMCNIAAASLLYGGLGRPEEGVDILERIYNNLSLNPFVIRSALNIAIGCRLGLGNLDIAKELQNRRDKIALQQSVLKDYMKPKNALTFFKGKKYAIATMVQMVQELEHASDMMLGDAESNHVS